MSAVEISQEERDLWRFEASDECGTPSEEDERILRLLGAFEACEAGLERSCEETRANFSELYRMANDVVPELKRRAEKAESDKAALEEDLEATEKNLKESSGFIEELLSGLKHRFPVQYADLEGDEYGDDAFSAHDLFEHVIDPAVDAAKEQAEAENARLRAELETAKQVAASAQAVAQEAWAGEIPSPLPGHKRASEDELLAHVVHLDCPLCGGSGHIGDCEGD